MLHWLIKRHLYSRLSNEINVSIILTVFFYLIACLFVCLFVCTRLVIYTTLTLGWIAWQFFIVLFKYMAIVNFENEHKMFNFSTITFQNRTLNLIYQKILNQVKIKRILLFFFLQILMFEENQRKFVSCHIPKNILDVVQYLTERQTASSILLKISSLKYNSWCT